MYQIQLVDDSKMLYVKLTHLGHFSKKNQKDFKTRLSFRNRLLFLRIIDFIWKKFSVRFFSFKKIIKKKLNISHESIDLIISQ